MSEYNVRILQQESVVSECALRQWLHERWRAERIPSRLHEPTESSYFVIRRYVSLPGRRGGSTLSKPGRTRERLYHLKHVLSMLSSTLRSTLRTDDWRCW